MNNIEIKMMKAAGLTEADFQKAYTVNHDDGGYSKRVERLIRERYTVSDEISILRQKDEKPEEYAAYYAYAEECKREARAECGGKTDGNPTAE